MGADARLAELGIELPDAVQPRASYVTVRRTGNLLFTAGHGPFGPHGESVTGKVGADLDLAAAQDAARLTGLGLLATIRAELGSLDRVKQVVKLLGMVNVAPGFTDISAVINGCSDLLVDVFGDAGRHARSAVGMAELPFGIAVEIEAIVEIQ